MIPLPIATPATSHPRHRRQGPLDPGGLFIVIVVVVHHRHHCMPPPPVTITWGWLLLGAACRHRHPHPCSPTLPQPYQRRNQRCLTPFLPPPVAVAPSPPSRSPMAPSWTGMRRRRPPVRRGECRSRPRPPFRKTGQLRQRRHQDRCDASVSSPAAGRPSLLGPPPSVGRWRRQHIDVDAHPGCLRRHDDDARPSRQSTSSL